MFKVPEEYRVTDPRLPFASDASYGNSGRFVFPLDDNVVVNVIASCGLGWEHVSVTLYEDEKPQLPTCDEMCMIKDLFWSKEACVVQYHPPESEYVNNHPMCLHLWRPTDQQIPMPPFIMVGTKSNKK